MKAFCPSTGTPLSYSLHPFFKDIPKVPQEQKAFFNRVFVKEGDIFEGFLFDWAPVNELILKEIYEGVKKLETFDILDVLVLNVVPAVATAKKM